MQLTARRIRAKQGLGPTKPDIIMFSLPDWAFYPLAAALTAGMIAGALSLGESNYRSPEQILEDGVRYEGEQLDAVTLGNGLEAAFLIEGEVRFARITASRGPLDGPQSAGAFYGLLPQEIEALQGHALEIRVWARRSSEQGAEGVRISLFTPGVGQGSWQRVTLGSDFEAISLTVTPPACNWNYGYLGLWPDWEFNADTVEIRAVEIRAGEAIAC